MFPRLAWTSGHASAYLRDTSSALGERSCPRAFQRNGTSPFHTGKVWIHRKELQGALEVNKLSFCQSKEGSKCQTQGLSIKNALPQMYESREWHLSGVTDFSYLNKGRRRGDASFPIWTVVFHSTLHQYAWIHIVLDNGESNPNFLERRFSARCRTLLGFEVLLGI